MYYKLFIFGQKEIFAIVEIPSDMSLKVDDIFIHNEKRYKIIQYLRIARDIVFDDAGRRVYEPHKDTKEDLSNAPLPELYITEIPVF